MHDSLRKAYVQNLRALRGPIRTVLSKSASMFANDKGLFPNSGSKG